MLRNDANNPFDLILAASLPASVLCRRTPVLSSSKLYVGIKGANNSTNASPVMGPIGVAANGVFIYGNADAEK